MKIVAGIASQPGSSDVDEQTIAQLLGEHPVYVVSRRRGIVPAFILAQYELAQAGVLWRVVPSHTLIAMYTRKDPIHSTWPRQ